MERSRIYRIKKWLCNYLKSCVHNIIVHPLMQLMPAKLATEMHDRNANWAFGLSRYDELKLENGDTRIVVT